MVKYEIPDLVPVARERLFETIEESMLVIDREHRIIDLNTAARQLLHAIPSPLGQYAEQVFTFCPGVSTWFKNGMSQPQIEVCLSNARSRSFEIRAYPLQIENGVPLGRLIVFKDVTEYRQTQQILQQREHFLTLLNDITCTALETRDVPTLLQILADRLGELFDADGCYLTLWDAERQMTIPGAAYGKWRDAYRSLQPKPGKATATESALRTGHPLVIDDVYDTPYLDSYIAEMFPDRSLLVLPLIVEGKGLGAALVAFNERHHFTPEEVRRGEQVAAQIALAVYKAQLVDALQENVAMLKARNEELDAFSYTVAHDLKNPLTQILGYAGLLDRELLHLSEDDKARAVHRIAVGGRHMSNIIDELLLLAHVWQTRDITLQPLDMHAIVTETLARLAYQIQTSGAEIELPDAWPGAVGHAPWVEQVWINYLNNALKYGGKPPWVKLGAAQGEDGFARFWVADNGPGLSSNEQQRLFTPFTRLDQAHTKGHGLGLSIVRRIVGKLGGQVGVESIPGKGSAFWFTLPNA